MSTARTTRWAVRQRRLLLAVVMAAGHVRGTLRYLLHPGVRREALTRAEILLRGTARQGRHRGVARALVAEQGLQWMAARWYRLARDMPIYGLEHLVEAESQSKGTMLATTHCGWIQALTWRMAVAGRPYTAVSGGWILHSTKPTDLRQMPMVDDGIAHGARHIVAGTGAFDQLNAVIAAGGRAGMAIDMPGAMELTYLGKPVRLGQATYRIAWANGAAVVPCGIRRRRLHLFIEILPAVLPSGHASVEEFAQAVTDVLSASSLRYAHLYLPSTISAMWPDGRAEAARPNRVHWAEKLGAEK